MNTTNNFQDIGLCFLDTETTGLKITDRILEVAFLNALFQFNFKDDSFCLKIKHDFTQTLYNPKIPIDPMAAATHGYWYSDIEGKTPLSESKDDIELLNNILSESYLVAYNANFDVLALEKEGVNITNLKVIDMLRIARHLFKDDENIQSYSLQYLRRYFDLDAKPYCQSILKYILTKHDIVKITPHTALSDIIVLIWLLQFVLKEGYVDSFEQILELTTTPVFHDLVRFGNQFPRGSSLRKAILSTYQSYGKTKTGLSYFNWVVNSMSIPLEEKLNISDAVLSLIQDGFLKVQPDCQPFLNYAQCFLPQYSYTIEQCEVFGKNAKFAQEAFKTSLLNEIEALKKEDEAKGIERERELSFLFEYARYKQECLDKAVGSSNE